ncbi:MAG: CapA family protein [Oribacterium sp.]|nr:CapA family protein [Oribacterium sp.]
MAKKMKGFASDIKMGNGRTKVSVVMILFLAVLSIAVTTMTASAGSRVAGHGWQPEATGVGNGMQPDGGNGSETVGTSNVSGVVMPGPTGANASGVMMPGSGSTGTAHSSGKLTMIAAGDNLIHKTIVDKAWHPELGTHDFHFLYTPILDTIQSRDLAVINQETIFISDNSLISDYPTFGTPQVMGEALVDTGFDIVLSATNHTWDKGVRGVNDTLNYWKTFHPEIKLLGIHDSPAAFNTIDYVEKNGIRLAMFNYTYGLNGFSVPGSLYYMVNLLGQKEKFLNDVRIAENEADMTVCFLHIGEEYHHQPTAFQQAYVYSLIDAGADLVICAHPHVVEPAGYVTTASGNSGLVFWSCGNLISAQSKVPRILGGLADVTIMKDDNGTRISSWNFIPTVTHFSGMDVRVFLLKDYNDWLAAKNHANYNDGPLTTARLWNLWTSITGFGREEDTSVTFSSMG